MHLLLLFCKCVGVGFRTQNLFDGNASFIIIFLNALEGVSNPEPLLRKLPQNQTVHLQRVFFEITWDLVFSFPTWTGVQILVWKWAHFHTIYTSTLHTRCVNTCRQTWLMRKYYAYSPFTYVNGCRQTTR